jgi:hypothetical protein
VRRSRRRSRRRSLASAFEFGYRLAGHGLDGLGISAGSRSPGGTVEIAYQPPHMGLIRRLLGLKALKPGWRDYEIAAALYLKGLGFRNVEVGKGSSDGGVDVRVPGRLVGQVKAHQAKVGRPPLQQIAGVASAEGVNAVFFSRAGYTKSAVEWAVAGEVGLFTISFDGDHFDVRAVNRLGDRLRP